MKEKYKQPKTVSSGGRRSNSKRARRVTEELRNAKGYDQLLKKRGASPFRK